MRGYADTGPAPAEALWTWLMAAHVVGQGLPSLHVDSHRRVLLLAGETRDWREVAGQLLRIVLLPFGHLLNRLPAGDTGRSTVGLTQEMEPPEPVQVLVDWAVLSTKLPG